MVNLTRIYTRTGDDGSTSLGDFSRTSKTDPASRHTPTSTMRRTARSGGARARRAPAELIPFCTGFRTNCSMWAPTCTAPARWRRLALWVSRDYIDRLEAECDRFNADLPILRSFIPAGRDEGLALLHVARTVTRRAERATWKAFGEYGIR